MNDVNMAFVGLMGIPDIGPINGKPAGRSGTLQASEAAPSSPDTPTRSNTMSTGAGRAKLG